MASTPPPISLRARTPPSPQHADSYEPYSPRRSKRSTAHSNPYSSFNSERSPRALALTPPTTIKRARFTRAPTQLSSPPSSPASPVKQLHKTPRKQTINSRKAAASSDSDDHLSSTKLAPPLIDPITMLPTPSKTPKKRQAVTSTARILSFQPNHPNDVMPSPRRIQKKHARSLKAMPGFELYEDEMDDGGKQIEIYTDANARVPEIDESEDNPFVGRRKKVEQLRPQQRRRGGRRKSKEEIELERRIEEAVRRDEGVTYVFRGKKIFRRFQEPDQDGASRDSHDSRGAPSTDLSGTPEQRRLKRQAGAAAQRPLTRSAIKPRLLFPSEEQLRERDEVDEEAVTDIEMGNADVAIHALEEDVTTPVNARFTHKPATPPSTTRVSRKKKAPAVAASLIPEINEEPEPMSVGTDDSFPTNVGGTRKGRGLFDSWPTSKSSRKRSGESSEGANGTKRTRGATLASPA